MTAQGSAPHAQDSGHSPDTVIGLTARLKAAAREFGFSQTGICPAVPATGFDRFHQWLAAGYAGEMTYLPGRAAAYAHPRHVLDGVRSICMLAFNYRTVEPQPPQPDRGRVSRYAWGHDYHDLIRDRLRGLSDFLTALVPAAKVRGVVDTAPLLERELAQFAGLGWIGKNTLLLNKWEGSWFFLAALLTDLELEYDQPHTSDHCGTCRACLDACPTGAFVDAYVLDARKCISYLTIEAKGAMPQELRTNVGEWLFGCDVCQEVCPWNHRAPLSPEPALRPIAQPSLDLVELFYLDDAQFRTRFRHTPLWRAKRRGLLRNAAVVLGNQARERGLEAPARHALMHGLSDPEPLVRASSAWALGQHKCGASGAALNERLATETDLEVRAEIAAALR